MVNNAMKEIVVRNDSGAVDPPQGTVVLSRAAGDSVRWVSRCAKPATIVFASNEGSPFPSRIFELEAQGAVDSGPLAGTALERGGVKVYKYSIMGSVANNDPIIIVQD